MQVRKVHPDRTLIELTPEETEELRKAIERMGETFSKLGPTIENLGKALGSATVALRSAIDGCQRLDPAFSGPAPDDEESFPIRRSPFPVPGPGTKEA